MTSTISYDKVIILKDLHRLPETTISKLLNETLKEIRHQRKYAVIVRKSIESWILAGLGVRDSEELSNPEVQLDTLLRRSKGIPYIKTL